MIKVSKQNDWIYHRERVQEIVYPLKYRLARSISPWYSIVVFTIIDLKWIEHHNFLNIPIAHIPKCTSPVYHNAPLCNKSVHLCAPFCYKMVHCGIFVWCIVGFLRLFYYNLRILWRFCYAFIKSPSSSKLLFFNTWPTKLFVFGKSLLRHASVAIDSCSVYSFAAVAYYLLECCSVLLLHMGYICDWTWAGWHFVGTCKHLVQYALWVLQTRYSDAILSAMVSQITGVSSVCSTVCSGADQRKHQSSTSLAFLGESTGDRTGGFPKQRASNAENVSIWWRHHALPEPLLDLSTWPQGNFDAAIFN